MKKITFLMVGVMLLASNVFAFDLSRFTGTWSLETDGEVQKVTITYNEGVLLIKGLLDDGDFKMDVLSKGTTTMLDVIPVSFTSGNTFDDTYIITVHIRTSEANGLPPEVSVPDHFVIISLTLVEDSAKLKVQMLEAGWGSADGLWAEVETWVFEKRE
jgi:hypothetical protein